MADITIVNGVYKPTYNWGAPSCGDDEDAEDGGWITNPKKPVENHHSETLGGFCNHQTVTGS
jgi:hypothetical protein